MDDVLGIVTEPEAVKDASIILRQCMVQGDEILVEASVRVAFVSGGRARSIPNPLRIAMRADGAFDCDAISRRRIKISAGMIEAPDKWLSR
jgi:hypothetical protein